MRSYWLGVLGVLFCIFTLAANAADKKYRDTSAEVSFSLQDNDPCADSAMAFERFYGVCAPVDVAEPFDWVARFNAEFYDTPKPRYARWDIGKRQRYRPVHLSNSYEPFNFAAVGFHPKV